MTSVCVRTSVPALPGMIRSGPGQLSDWSPRGRQEPSAASLFLIARCRAVRLSEPGNPITVAVRVVAGRARPARPGVPRAPVRPPTGRSCSSRRLCVILRRTPVALLGALMDLCEITYRNEIVGGSVEHAQELGARIVEAPKFEQGPTEGDPRRQIRRVLSQTGLAHPNGLFAVTRPPVFLRELCKCNRRRILAGPGVGILNPRVMRHA